MKNYVIDTECTLIQKAPNALCGLFQEKIGL